MQIQPQNHAFISCTFWKEYVRNEHYEKNPSIIQPDREQKINYSLFAILPITLMEFQISGNLLSIKTERATTDLQLS